MSSIKVEGLSKAFGAETLFSGVSFELRRGEKAGLVGANGTGKTTLLRCLLGLEQPDGGRVSLPAGDTIGYVEQDAGMLTGTLYDALLSAYQDVLAWQAEMRRLEDAIACQNGGNETEALMKAYAAAVERFERGGGYQYENTIRRVAFGLGFGADDFSRPASAFSGGQKTRIALARALLRQPDFLFLDEPTNHLDIAMVEWLEEFLAGYPGGALIISHDRYFLDKVANRILELENRSVTMYNGSYSVYSLQKAERQAAMERAYEKQQAYIERTEAYINRYRAGIKSKQARGRQAQLNRLERISLPERATAFSFAFQALGECAERVAELENVTAAYGARTVFKKLSLLIRRGDGVALVGPNGAGKTTLLRLLTGAVTPLEGRIKLGSRVRAGYFSQEHEGLNPAYRVIDEIMAEYGFSEERARHLLGAFLFRGDEVFKTVGDLSGGEKARLSLLKLMLSGANFLILDEPTNHLDIPAREAVEDAILSFPGTFLVVSHDRYFLDKIADRVAELDNGQLTEYAGNYSYYREKKLLCEKEAARSAAPAARSGASATKPARQRPRKQDTVRELQKLENEIRGLEAMIGVLEKRLNDPASHANLPLSRELADEYSRMQDELAAKYNEWLELSESAPEDS